MPPHHPPAPHPQDQCIPDVGPALPCEGDGLRAGQSKKRWSAAARTPDKGHKGVCCGRACGIDRWQPRPQHSKRQDSRLLLNFCRRLTESTPLLTPPCPYPSSPSPRLCQRLCIGQAEVDTLSRQRVHRMGSIAHQRQAGEHIPAKGEGIKGGTSQPAQEGVEGKFLQGGGAQ